MLLQLAIENVLSFRERAVLSMLAASDAGPNRVRVPGVGSVLRATALYGANGAGKSNLVLAHEMARSLVREGTRVGASPAVRPFKPGGHRRPSCWQYSLWLSERIVHYGLEVADGVIVREYYSEERDQTERYFFQRDRQQIELGEAAPSDKERRQFLSFVAEGTRPEQPFVAECGQRNVHELSDLRDWFQGIQAEDLGVISKRVCQIYLAVPRFRAFATTLLQGASVGIDEIRVQTTADELLAVSRGERQAQADEIDRLIEADKDFRIDFIRNVGGNRVAFEFEELSDGTRRLIELSRVWRGLVGAGISTQFVDELDRSLHPMLSKHLLSIFVQSDQASQLVFTTHETNLLDPELLGPDGIWFCDRSATGNSRLRSLVEYQEHELRELDDRLIEAYMQGRLGGVPRLSPPLATARR